MQVKEGISRKDVSIMGLLNATYTPIMADGRYQAKVTGIQEIANPDTVIITLTTTTEPVTVVQYKVTTKRFNYTVTKLAKQLGVDATKHTLDQLLKLARKNPIEFEFSYTPDYGEQVNL